MSTRLPDRSERLLMQLVADKLSVRWYVGYNLDEPLPDHSSLTRIRERYGVELFRRFFEAIVDQCQQAGLVWGKELLCRRDQSQCECFDGVGQTSLCRRGASREPVRS